MKIVCKRKIRYIEVPLYREYSICYGSKFWIRITYYTQSNIGVKIQNFLHFDRSKINTNMLKITGKSFSAVLGSVCLNFNSIL